MDARQQQEGESRRDWLRRRVTEIMEGDGVLFHQSRTREHLDTGIGGLIFEKQDTPPGTVSIGYGGSFYASVGQEPDKLFPEQVMQLAGSAILKAQELGLKCVEVRIHEETVSPRLVCMGVQSALLRADEFKTDARPGINEIRLMGMDMQEIGDAMTLARASNAGRWLTALPPNILGVDEFHRLLLDTFLPDGKPCEGVTLLGENGEPTEAEYAHMGLLNAVAQGADGSRKVFAIRIDPASGPTDQVVAYVGKTLVFDTGGYNLKGDHARTMKMDMGGGARLLGDALYLLRNRYHMHRSVVLVWTITKNMIGPDGYLPDDVLTAFSGKTVEVDNTDAEGRLALADAMAWICTKVSVSQLVAVCTLTGAAVTALGSAATALHLKNSRRRLDEVRALEELSFRAGDPVNVLHHFDLGGTFLKSPIADIKNAGSGKKNAGSQQGFAFLLLHAPEGVDVMELDIAGSTGDFSDTDGIVLGTSRPSATWFIIAREMSPQD